MISRVLKSISIGRVLAVAAITVIGTLWYQLEVADENLLAERLKVATCEDTKQKVADAQAENIRLEKEAEAIRQRQREETRQRYEQMIDEAKARDTERQEVLTDESCAAFLAMPACSAIDERLRRRWADLQDAHRPSAHH